MHGFVQKVHRRIREKKLFARSDRLVLAVSGGPDSVSMACALHTLNYQLTLAWVDHGQRKTAADEGRLVERLSKTLDTPFISLLAQPTGHSESALRDARYEVLAQCEGDWVATAHTASDQAETVLMRMIRGTGVTGLSGIPDIRGRYVRPLLGVTRGDVLSYLASIEQEYAIDPTNASLDPLRNRVRHRLLPVLESEFQPQIARSLQRLAESVTLDREALESAVMKHTELNGSATAALRAVSEGFRVHVVRHLCPVSITLERATAVSRLVVGDIRGKVQIEGGVYAAIERGNLVFIYE